MHLKSELLSRIPGIEHGFGSITEPVPAPFAAQWLASKASWSQVHKTDCAELRSVGQDCGEVDAQLTYARCVPAAAMHADCTPILLARRDGGAVAAIHAGWRGTLSHILSAVWLMLAAKGEKAEQWVGAVGPTIGPCCYEVSEELADDFAREFGPSAVPTFRHLDLPEINAAELRSLRFAEVEVLRACTRCAVDPVNGAPLFHSYRREQNKTRQYAVIARI